MLASGSWYTSAATIGWAAITVTVIFGVAAIVLWYLGIPRRLLIFTAESTSLLLTAGLPYDDDYDDDVKVTIRGQAVADPHLVTLKIASRSRRDIRVSDFDEGKPLLFDLGVPIVAARGSVFENQKAPSLGSDLITPSADNTPSCSIQLQPALVNKGPWCRLHLLTEGSPHLTYRNPIADVTVRRGSPAKSRLIYIAIGIQAGCLLFEGGIIANPHPDWPEVIIAIILMLTAIAIGGALITVWRRRPS